MSASLKNIAAKTNLSVRTVAYILNTDRAKLFRVETRRRVEDAAHELGYRPNSAAQAMRRGKFDAIGLIQAARPDRGLLNVYTLAAIEDELLQRDQRLVMSMVRDDRLTAEDKLPPMLREWSVDGLLVAYNAGAPTAFVERLEQERRPSVWVNTKRERDSVFCDDVAGSEEVTRRLISLGHRRIAYLHFFKPSPTSHHSVEDRQSGYLNVMKEAGLVPEVVTPDRVMEPEERIPFAMSLLSRDDRPTAVVTYAGSDHALPVLMAAKELGLRLGTDLSLVGFNEGLMSESGVVITTMAVPTYTVGVEAVKMLFDQIDAGKRMSVPSRVLKHDYFPGQTIGPVGHGGGGGGGVRK